MEAGGSGWGVGMTQVDNVRKYLGGNRLVAPANAVYVGRYMPSYGLQPSIFQNRFRIGLDGTREQVIRKFEVELRSSPELLRLVRVELKDKLLLCWCHPSPCHADVLAKIADGYGEAR
jgi:Domain of unknown function (DUF4326)